MNCNGVGYNSPHCVPMDLQLDVHTPSKNASTGATPDKLKPAVRTWEQSRQAPFSAA
jgi:hypothetical protein